MLTAELLAQPSWLNKRVDCISKRFWDGHANYAVFFFLDSECEDEAFVKPNRVAYRKAMFPFPTLWNLPAWDGLVREGA